MDVTRLALAGVVALAACGDPAPGPSPASRAAAARPGLSIEATDDELTPTFVARIPAEAGDALASGKVDEASGRGFLRLQVDGLGPDTPPIIGRYEHVGGELRFSPAIPLQPGTRYRATLDHVGGDAHTLEYETHAAVQAEPTRVVSIDPVVDRVPANLLRFYANFSAPMRGGEEFYEHVHLVDLSTGEPVAMAWREIQLWSVDRKRLTLLVHPGRVKRDITFAKQLGPVLHEDRRYELILDRELLDASGNMLAESFHRSFDVLASDGEGPDPSAWAIDGPTAGSRDSVTLRLDEPMDAELLRTRISVLDAAGDVIAGSVTLPAGGSSWQFDPAAAWGSGAFTLAFSGELEDLAGNTSTAPFDRPVGWKTDAKPVLRLAFDVSE